MFVLPAGGPLTLKRLPTPLYPLVEEVGPLVKGREVGPLNVLVGPL